MQKSRIDEMELVSQDTVLTRRPVHLQIKLEMVEIAERPYNERDSFIQRSAICSQCCRMVLECKVSSNLQFFGRRSKVSQRDAKTIQYRRSS